MSNNDREYYCDYCAVELRWKDVTYDERHETCGNKVGGEFAGRDHARLVALEAQAERDGDVIQALLAVRENEAGITYLDENENDDASWLAEYEALCDKHNVLIAALDAALAAREAGKGAE